MTAGMHREKRGKRMEQQNTDQNAVPGAAPKKKGAFFKKYWVAIATVAALVIIAGVWLLMGNARAYKDAEDLLAKGRYEEAVERFEALGSYRDAPERVKQASYDNAMAYYEDGAYDDAIAWFEKAGDYSDAAEQKNRSIYARGDQLFAQGAYEEAEAYFGRLGDALETYGVLHFATLEDARDTIVEKALSGEETITVAIGDLETCMAQTNGRRGLIHLAQAELGEVEADGKTLTIRPVAYPGVRIVAAWKADRLDSLSEEERRTYEKAQGVVQQAKAKTENALELEAFLHNWLCQNVTYDNTNAGLLTGGGTLQPEWTATSALLKGKANCQGFSDAFYLLGQLAGFEVRFQYGTVGGEAHCWNAIKLDDAQWYYVDVTYDNDIERFLPEGQTYAYLNFGEDHEQRTLWPNSRSAEVAESDNAAYDLYRHNGTAFDTLDSAARYCIDQRETHNQAQAAVMVASGGLDHNDLSNALAEILNGRGIAANWTVFSISTPGATYLNVRWDSFGG